MNAFDFTLHYNYIFNSSKSNYFKTWFKPGVPKVVRRKTQKSACIWSVYKQNSNSVLILTLHSLFKAIGRSVVCLMAPAIIDLLCILGKDS